MRGDTRTLKVGSTVEIRPGINTSGKSKREVYEPIIAVIKEMSNGSEKITEAVLQED